GVMLGLERGDFAVVQDFGSDGKTTVLDYVHTELGGGRIGVRDFLAKLAMYEPVAIEEAFLDILEQAMERHDLVIVDDLHLVRNVAEACDYPRKELFECVLAAALERAAAAKKKLVFAASAVPEMLARRARIASKASSFSSTGP